MSDITIIREKEPASVLLAIVIALAAVGTFMFIVVLGRIQALQEEVALSNIPPVDISGWATYHNDQYGFEIEYPAGWQLLTAGLTSDTPYLVLGNPPTGIKTYAMQIFIENNPNMLSSGILRPRAPHFAPGGGRREQSGCLRTPAAAYPEFREDLHTQYGRGIPPMSFIRCLNSTIMRSGFTLRTERSRCGSIFRSPKKIPIFPCRWRTMAWRTIS